MNGITTMKGGIEADLYDQLQRAAEDFLEAVDSAVQKGWTLGGVLIRVKAEVGHGGLYVWLAEHLPHLNERYARRCMSIAKKYPATAPDLSITFSEAAGVSRGNKGDKSNRTRVSDMTKKAIGKAEDDEELIEAVEVVRDHMMNTQHGAERWQEFVTAQGGIIEAEVVPDTPALEAPLPDALDALLTAHGPTAVIDELLAREHVRADLREALAELDGAEPEAEESTATERTYVWGGGDTYVQVDDDEPEADDEDSSEDEPDEVLSDDFGDTLKSFREAAALEDRVRDAAKAASWKLRKVGNSDHRNPKFSAKVDGAVPADLAALNAKAKSFRLTDVAKALGIDDDAVQRIAARTNWALPGAEALNS